MISRFSNRRSMRYAKITMRRNSIDCGLLCMRIQVNKVPNDVALDILNSLINNGFDVEGFVSGYLKGLKLIFLYSVLFEVTRLSKN